MTLTAAALLVVMIIGGDASRLPVNLTATYTGQESASLPRQARDSHLLHGLIIANGIASAADLSVTQFGIGAGKLREANPLMKWAERKPIGMAVAKGAAATFTSVVLIKMHRKHPKAAMVMATALTLLNGYVAVRNARLLR